MFGQRRSRQAGHHTGEVVALFRSHWSSFQSDKVYAVKLVFDLLVQPEFREDADGDFVCVLVARIGPNAELVDAPPGYTQPKYPHVRLSHIVGGTPLRGKVPDPSAPAEYLLAFLDVLGSKELMRVEGLEKVHALYNEMLASALVPQSEERPLAKAFSRVRDSLVPSLMWMPIQTAYFSDSILIWVNYHPSFVHEFLRRTGHVLCESLRLGMPLRGAITYGRAVLNKSASTYLGPPLIEAAQLEAAQEWIGVTIGASFKTTHIQLPIPPDMVQLHSAPLKPNAAALASGLVLDWPRIWRDNYSSDARVQLKALCRDAMPDSVRRKYAAAIEFYDKSEAMKDWFLQPGEVMMKA